MAARGPLERAVNSSARTAQVGPLDKAALELARSYARNLDNDGELDKIGPKLLAALEALGLTPRARTGGKEVSSGQPSANPVTRLRAVREDRAKALDATAS